MTDVIETILRNKPHLAEPFRFYKKALLFIESMAELDLRGSVSRNAYDPKLAPAIFERFSSFLDLPAGSLDPLKHAMELGEIDFLRLPFNEIPAFSLPYPEDDLAMLLFLLSKPYFLSRAAESDSTNTTWEDGKCPVCRGRPAVMWSAANRRLTVWCSFCETTGYVRKSRCAVCQTGQSGTQRVLAFAREKGFKINTCNVCQSYLKHVEADLISELGSAAADLMSLPLDVLVQEKGFRRRSPNPLGMQKISARG